ncbi:hypothetical protein V3565_04825 [Bartonella sp. B10]
MFKIFKIRTRSCVCVALVLWLAHTAAGYGNVIKSPFQQKSVTVTQEKNTPIKVLDAVVRHYDLKQDELAFGKIEKASLSDRSSGNGSSFFKVLWGGMSIGSLIISVATGNIMGVAFSLISLLL